MYTTVYKLVAAAIVVINVRVETVRLCQGRVGNYQHQQSSSSDERVE